MTVAYIVDGVRTAFGKAGGAIAGVRPDDLAATVMSTLVERNPSIDPSAIEDVYWGATNQSGDDSRNVARISAVLAGLPHTVAGASVNRLCGSGLESVVQAARAVKSGELDVCIAGGSESMSRAPFILPRADSAYQRAQPVWDSRLGWRSINPQWKAQYGARTLLECAEITAEQYSVTREEQDAIAVRSHRLAAAAWESGLLAGETIPVVVEGRALLTIDQSVRPDATMESIGALRPLVSADGGVTAGNASPMSDGASGMVIVSEDAVNRWGLTPRARIVGGASVGVDPDGLDGPVPSTRRLCEKIGWSTESFDAVEMTEAYASQVVACVRELHFDLEIVNPWGGAIAIGHPLGASGSRLLNTLVSRLEHSGGRRGLATMCIGVGQGISVAVERC
ncbi:thiolase family protein [soil metagenome]